MRILSDGKPVVFEPLDDTPHHVERWYDRHTRSWVVQLMTKGGDQIGDAVYVHSKAEAKRAEAFFKEQIK